MNACHTHEQRWAAGIDEDPTDMTARAEKSKKPETGALRKVIHSFLINE